MELREELLRKGYRFESETDTEVIVHLIEMYYAGDFRKAVMKASSRLVGSYALGIVCTDAPDTVLAVREASPLILGVGIGENFFASDVTALVAHTRNVIYLEDGELAELTPDSIQVYDCSGHPITKKASRITWDIQAAEKGGYDHFMLKEIMEQPRAVEAEGKLCEGAKIGMINCFAPPYTKENPSPEDLEAVRMTDGLHNRWWLDVVAHGHLPQDVLDTVENDWKVEINRRPGDEAILAQGKVDWLGFNYYQPTRVQAPDSKFDENGLPCISKPYIWPERKMNVYRGWEIYPKGIYDFGMKIKKECPDLPFFISENGMGVEGEEKYMDENGTVQDDYRIEFVRDHLEWIAKAIEDGANCLGYHYWGVIDNWSWCNAFKNRYGFIRVCLDDGYKRKEKKSASWIREVARTNEFE